MLPVAEERLETSCSGMPQENGKHSFLAVPPAQLSEGQQSTGLQTAALLPRRPQLPTLLWCRDFFFFCLSFLLF